MLKAERMARNALKVSKVALAASSLTGVAGLVAWWYGAVESMALVNDCCTPGPTVPSPLPTALVLVEILSSIAVALAIAAFIQWRLERRPPDCGTRATVALLFGLLSLAIVIAAHICLR